MSEALRRLVAQVYSKTDVSIGGSAVQARRLISEAAQVLAAQTKVVSISSPIGELGLSVLIAQLSGRPDLDGQDDAVLELGFKRLTGDGPTVLMMLAPEGISRSALRYLQHVARQSPRLTLVVYYAPPLAAMLEEPGFSALRDRLLAASPIDCVAPPENVPDRAVAIVPSPVVTATRGLSLAVLATPARRPAIWLVSALSAAAIAGIAFVGQSTPNDAVAGSRTAHAAVPLELAVVPVPVLADAPDPAEAKPILPTATGLAMPALVHPAPSATAKLPQIALASPSSQPQSVSLPHADPVAAGPIQRMAKSLRAQQMRRPDPSRREAARFVPASPYWSAPRYQEPAEYEAVQPYDNMPPGWVRRDLRRRDGPYLGTYAMDAYGMRNFRYDR